MQKTSGLGRGLGSLIPSKKPVKELLGSDSEVADILDTREKISQLPVGQITPNPHQPRTTFNEDELQELVDSIKEHGVIQPIIVTKLGNGWQLIAGERRLRSSKLAGLNTIPAIIREMDEQKKMEIALIENLQRKNLNSLETAFAYQKLIDEFNLTQDQLSKRVGKSRSAVANTLRILTVIDEVKEAIRDGKISEGHARVLAGLPAIDQLSTLQKILSDSLSVRDTEKAGKKVVVEKHIRKVAFDPEVKAKEELLQSALGTKVEIKKTGSTGQINIKFFSEEELKTLIDKLV
ncbi:ParB/RepB/Spo0J family partition protein [Candidatus Falkowbacteria bacterium]|uniref:Stage 0 sporulation protein J n=1 Tax=Candidatus Buchananbacteria bacterium CG10_big_fil_rev_8_21_14_0_10_33_19 TaxID=1974525 RepID=A0A2H0W2S3_9BACT|nr:ParB/RepB/Spo0J family partition protein [Candidatus Falkowbacteria bacterium]PIS05662.1 MAG: stage 0 sporulation protein J [Candidatus Buchananbacteria bacterium CG10_big_fil_rev_8_21_14_0_10_33_19]